MNFGGLTCLLDFPYSNSIFLQFIVCPRNKEGKLDGQYDLEAMNMVNVKMGLDIFSNELVPLDGVSATTVGLERWLQK
jgi:hypothetical protein